MHGVLAWVAFNATVLAILALDLGVLNRRAHAPSLREAALFSAGWVSLALGFAALVFWLRGHQVGLEFVTGYLIEYSLSVDNIFVIVLIFAYFGIRSEFQHRVLFWGIIGALVMRGAMIGVGAVLVARFHWVTYLFGAFLVVTGVRMLRHDDSAVDPESNPAVRLLRRFIPVATELSGQRFIVLEQDPRTGTPRRAATPLLVVLVVIETMDLVFAVDSIPAVFAVTQDPFIVYTSNVAAILGLRSLYFLLAGAVAKFRYLRPALAVVLAFVGVKMLLAVRYVIPTLASLGVILGVLTVAAVASIVVQRRPTA